MVRNVPRVPTVGRILDSPGRPGLSRPPPERSSVVPQGNLRIPPGSSFDIHPLFRAPTVREGCRTPVAHAPGSEDLETTSHSTFITISADSSFAAMLKPAQARKFGTTLAAGT